MGRRGSGRVGATPLAIRLAAVLACLAASCGPAAADDCVLTYDRKGQVTGQFCPDGSSKPPPAGKRAARAPDAVDPESTVPSDVRKGGAAAGVKAAPKNGQIQCGQWKNANGTGCRGIFTILR